MARSAAKTQNPAVNASRLSDLRALANFPLKRAVAFGQPFLSFDDLFGRLAPERVRHIRASRGVEFVLRVWDRIPFHV
jgi:hypothetical protein